MARLIRTEWTLTNAEIAERIEAETGCRVLALRRSSGLWCEADVMLGRMRRTIDVRDCMAPDDLLAAVWL